VQAARAGAHTDTRDAPRAAVADALRCEQGLSQDQLFAALPALDVQRVAESLNTLLSRVRTPEPPAQRWTCALPCADARLRLQGRIQLYSAGAGGPSAATATPVFKFVKPEELVKCVGCASCGRLCVCCQRSA
jgi:hypothetical protein